MRKSAIALSLILFFFAIALYTVDLGNMLFFDDDHLIINNESIRSFSIENARTWFTENAFAGAGRLSDYYRPLLLASFAVNHAIHGIDPLGYFLTNNVLHAINGVVVFFLTLSLFQKKWLAFLVALVFLIHPMQSENVAYVSGRGDLLSSFFMLLGLIVWGTGVKTRNRVLSVFLPCIMLVFALLSRENAVIFPLLVFVLSVAFFSKEQFWHSVREGVLRMLPFLAVVAGYLALRLTVLNFRNFLNFGNFDATSAYAQDIFVRLYTFLHVLLEYLQTFYIPTGVYERFTFPIHESFFEYPVWLSFLGLVVLLGWLFFLYTKEGTRDTRVAHTQEEDITDFRIWFFATGWFFAALLPSTGIIPTNTIIQDHRLYLAMIGLLVLCFYYGGKAVTFARAQGYNFVRPIAIIALFLFLAWFSWLTVERASIWGKPDQLFKETLRHEPGSPKALLGLAVFYISQKEFEKAEPYLRRGINNGYPLYEFYANLAYIYQHASYRDMNIAEANYKKALELNPGSWYVHRRLAELYMEQGSPEAVYYLKKLHEFQPRDANIHYNLALVLHLLGSRTEAHQWAAEGKALVADNVEATEAFRELEARILSSDEETSDN